MRGKRKCAFATELDGSTILGGVYGDVELTCSVDE